MNDLSLLRARWASLGRREKILAAATAVLVVAALVWWIAFAPALATLRTAEQQHHLLDTQLRRMLSLQAQAQTLKAQPKQTHDEAVRLVELSVRERLGTTARLLVSDDRATVTLTGTTPEALSQWLTQARVNAHALPSEAHLSRNASGLWEGTLVLTLPPR